MSLYKYKAKDREGKVYDRTVDVENRYEIYSLIREEGGRVVSIQEVRKFAFISSFRKLFSNIKTQQKITFAKNLGLMMDAGLPVTRALAVMGKQSTNRAFKKLLSHIETDVSHGKTLSEALGKRPDVFSTLFASMVRAGEESGNVSGALKIVAGQMEKSYLLTKTVRGAMIYPAIIITVMIIIAVLLLIFMVPTLTATFEGIGAKLPWSTRLLIFLSEFVVENTVNVILAIVIFVTGATLFFRSKLGHNITDTVFIKIPIIGEMVREFESARTTRTLSSLLSAGVEIVVALDATVDVLQNHHYKNAIKKARTAVEKGEQMSTVFAEHSNLYPLFVGEMIAVGEETGKISEMLMNIASYYEAEVDQKTKNLSTIIEPALMVVIGVGVGFFAISLLAPTYSLVDYI